MTSESVLIEQYANCGRGYDLDNSFDEINKPSNLDNSFNCFAHQSLMNLGDILKRNPFTEDASEERPEALEMNVNNDNDELGCVRLGVRSSLRRRKIKSFNFVNSRARINGYLSRQYEKENTKQSPATPKDLNKMRYNTFKDSNDTSRCLEFSVEKTEPRNDKETLDLSEQKATSEATSETSDASGLALKKSKGFNFKNSKQKISTIITKTDSFSQDSRLDETSLENGNLSQILAGINLSHNRENSLTNDLSSIIEEHSMESNLKKSQSVNESFQGSQFNKKKLKGFNFRNSNISGKQKNENEL